MVIATSASMRLNINLKIRCILGAMDNNEAYGAEDLVKLLKVCNLATSEAIIAQRHAEHVAFNRCTINS